MKKGNGGTSLGRFKPTFTQSQEDEVVAHCKLLNRMYYGLSFKSLRCLLFNFAEENNIQHRFSKDTKAAGKDFTIDFMKRHNLSLCMPRKTSVARTMGFNRTQIDGFFENLKDAYDKYKFSPGNIYNMDETGIQTVPSKLPKIVSQKGQKEVSKNVSAEQGQTVSVVCCTSPLGNYVPPFFIYKRKRENPILIKGGPEGCRMAVTEKGYMDMDTPTFLKWLDHFQEFAKATTDSPVLLILDNHASHVNIDVVTKAKSLNIVMLSLPPHSSHKTQPLDRAFFKPLKSNYDQVTDSWQSTHPGQTLTVFHVAELFKQAYERTATIEKSSASFRVTGIFPLDPGVFSDEDFLPSEVTNQEEEPEPMVDFGDLPVASVSTAPEALASVVLASPVSPAHHTPSRPFEGAAAPEDCVQSVPVVATTSTALVSPADILPLPKLTIKHKRGGRGLKSTGLTSTPNKMMLIEKKE